MIDEIAFEKSSQIRFINANCIENESQDQLRKTIMVVIVQLETCPF